MDIKNLENIIYSRVSKVIQSGVKLKTGWNCSFVEIPTSSKYLLTGHTNGVNIIEAICLYYQSKSNNIDYACIEILGLENNTESRNFISNLKYGYWNEMDSYNYDPIKYNDQILGFELGKQIVRDYENEKLKNYHCPDCIKL